MSTTSEEPREKIEWVVSPSAASPLLALLQTFMSILVVDLSRLRVGERFVGFGDFDELLLCSSISTLMLLVE
jgi:hypothetical protein